MGEQKYPIYPAEIERYRESIQLGQRIRLVIQAVDLDSRKKTIYRVCTITAKHKWLFMAEDKNGKKYAVTYIDRMIKER